MRLALFLAIALSSLLISPVASADGHHGHSHGGYNGYHGSGWYGRPRVGVSVNFGAPYPWGYAGAGYYYGGGPWLRSYSVIAPPIGVVVAALPPYYSVRSYSGSTYYVANDVYYTANPAGDGYVVANTPAEMLAPAENPAGTAPQQVFAYPRKGQTADQQARDQFECHEWASAQTGFDPMKPQGGLPASQVDRKRSDYQRASAACLDGRGYAMR